MHFTMERHGFFKRLLVAHDNSINKSDNVMPQSPALINNITSQLGIPGEERVEHFTHRGAFHMHGTFTRTDSGRWREPAGQGGCDHDGWHTTRLANSSCGSCGFQPTLPGNAREVRLRV